MSFYWFPFYGLSQRRIWPWVIYSPTMYWTCLKRQVRHRDNKRNKTSLSSRSSPSSRIQTEGLPHAVCLDRGVSGVLVGLVEPVEGETLSPALPALKLHHSKMPGCYSEGPLPHPFKCNSLQGEKYVYGSFQNNGTLIAVSSFKHFIRENCNDKGLLAIWLFLLG